MIAELPYREVQAARVDGREPIPLLEDLLGAFPEARVNIDPKHDGVVDALAEVIRRTGSIGRVCCGLFSDARSTRLRRILGPELCTSLGPRSILALRAASFGAPARRMPAPCVQVPHRYKGRVVTDARLVRTAHALGLQVHVWTVDDAEEMTELLDLGVDGIMTDHPAVLKELLVQRGDWSG